MSAYRGHAVSLILPSPARTVMLRAALLEGEACRDAWAEWEERHGGMRSVLRGGRDGVKRILPVIERAAARCDVELEPVVRTCLRSATTRETFRSRTYQRLVHDGLRGLRDAGVPFLVLRGAALAEREYEQPALRHCHDCDLLVDAADLDRAAEAVAASGFARFLDEERAGGRRVVVAHSTGLPIQMHARLFTLPRHTAPQAEMIGRAEPRTVCGIETRVLAPDDALLHVLGHASTWGSRDHLYWACDAWNIIAAHPDLAWDRLTESTQRSHLAPAVSVMLDWLAEELGAPIDGDARKTLARAAAGATHVDREAALVGASVGTNGGVKAMLAAAQSWRERLDIVRWVVLPAPGNLRWAYHLDEGWRVPIFYAYRPLRGVIRRLRPPAGPAGTPLPVFMDEEAETSGAATA